MGYAIRYADSIVGPPKGSSVGKYNFGTIRLQGNMDQNIVVVGSNDADCQRIKETLRRRFKNVIVQVSEWPPAGDHNGIIIVTEPRPPHASTNHELEERIRRAEFLFETTRILSSPLPLQERLDAAVVRSQSVLGETAIVVLLDGDRPRLQCVTSSNDEQLRELLISLVNLPSPELEIVLQRVMNTDDALFIPDLLATDELPPSVTALSQQLQLKTVIATAIKRGERVFGIFITASSKPDGLSQDDLTASEEFSSALAAAIAHAETMKHLEERANTDSLTGIYNARFFSEVLALEVARAERHKTALSLLLVDVDHFKRINDNFGHIAGNEVLKKLAHIFQRSVRMTDVLFRAGGDEFGVLLPGTNLSDGLRVGEHIRSRVEAADLLPGKIPRGGLTISVGVAEYVPGLGSVGFQTCTDEALYNAKALSKNNVQGFGLVSSSMPIVDSDDAEAS